MSLKVIELKQTDPLASVFKNGDYELQTSEKILVPPNSEIVMKKAFLDTSAFNTQQIIVPEDLTLEFDVLDYIVNNTGFENVSTTLLGSSSGLGTIAVPPATTGTGLPMFRSRKHTVGTQDRIATNLEFNKKFTGTGNNWGLGQQLTFEYKDYTNNTRTFHITLPTLPSSNFSYDVSINIACLDNSIKDVTSQDIQAKAGYRPFDGSFTGSQVTYNNPPSIVYELVHNFGGNTITKTLPSGIYQPNELAEQITQLCQEARTGDVFTVGNNFVSGSFMKEVANQTGDDCMAVGFDVSKGFNLPTGSDSLGAVFQFGTTGYYSGASQVALEYVEEFNKFSWSFNVIPNYGADKKIAVSKGSFPEFKSDGDNSIDPYGYYQQVGGGVIFMSLRCLNPDGSSNPFWTETLGFDLDVLCPKPEYKNSIRGDGAITINTQGFCQLESLFKTGITVTAPLLIEDMNIVKGTDYQKSGQIVSETNVENFTSILASKQVLEASVSTGFYFIDVLSNFSNEIIGVDENFKHTVGIVSNYFNQNSFTTGTDADTLIYTHRSDYPIYLSNFHIRILDSNRNLASNLGENNVVFLEVRQAVPPIQPLLTMKNDDKK